ncbi:DNA mismatch repair protein [Metarhizium robertsii ARSEF 23]|uniref:DNA mismatch repair protein MSH3 n=1 Tax=Metarhizium robertsii (strain ARSEF 23 / ATCC MYA-3075) TaxID=655844 RepID=E9F6P0_METRA|nr:DNA mismatch repair protein [Metarhizium robertsii ARSEF 23]EFY96656.2 DNA mismatch repair protein [Metarhizium robertsii ARSEF 23]
MPRQPRQSRSSSMTSSYFQHPSRALNTSSSTSSRRPPRIISEGGSSITATPSIAGTVSSTAKSNITAGRSRPSTSVSGRKSRTGTLSTMLGASDQQTIICAVAESRGISPSIGLALVNITLGEAVLSQICDNQSYVKTIHKLQIAGPSRIVLMSTACPPNKDSVLYTLIDELIPDADIEVLDRSAWSEADGLEYIDNLAFKSDIDPMKVAVQGKYYCISSLAANLDKPKSKDSLFGLLNQTKTPMGSRMLRNNILQPPTKYSTFIRPRYEALEELTSEEEMFHAVRKGNFPNPEDMITISTKSSITHAEEQINHVILIKTFLESVPELYQALAECNSALLLKIRDICHPNTTDPILSRIHQVVEADVTYMTSPLDMRNQRTYAVKAGINDMLDVARQAYKELTNDIHLHVNDIQAQHGIQLTVKFDHGRKYWLRIKSGDLNKDTLPQVFINVVKKKDHIQCQTLSLVKLNFRLSETSNEIIMRSDKVIQELILDLRESSPQLFRVCESVALVDMIASFAHLATIRDYVRPEILDTLALKAARHPILDNIMFEGFVPNDYYATPQHRFHIVTGCNMAGKTTYIRAIALLQIMAQIGCFVPAEYASFPVMHNLFARVSLTDNLEANLSTYSLEMREMAFILRNVNGKSLVIIDELGRGTSPRDGLAMAIAMSEALIQSGAFVWFATHFVDLTRVLEDRPGVLSLHLASERSISDEGEPRLVMLYKAKSGVVDTNQHYGIDLARAIGFPEPFTKRAEEVAKALRQQREASLRDSESRRLVARRKLVLSLHEALKQAYEYGSDEALPGYLKHLQEDFISRMNDLEIS